MLPTILYADQKWSLAGKYNKMIQVCQHKLERKIDFLGVIMKNKVQNIYVRRMTSMRNAVAWTEMLKWSERIYSMKGLMEMDTT